jgi:hypothetical protein
VVCVLNCNLSSTSVYINNADPSFSFHVGIPFSNSAQVQNVTTLPNGLETAADHHAPSVSSPYTLSHLGPLLPSILYRSLYFACTIFVMVLQSIFRPNVPLRAEVAKTTWQVPNTRTTIWSA